MSIHYLYVSQRDEDPSSVTIVDYKALQPNIRDMKFMIMHCGGDVMGCVNRFLTRGGYQYTQAAAFAPASISAHTFRLMHAKPFPLSELYLTLGPLQSEVIIRLYNRQPIDVNINALVETVDKVAHRIDETDKLLASVVTENMEQKRLIDELTRMSDESIIREEALMTIAARDADRIKQLEERNTEMLSRVDHLSSHIINLESIINGDIKIIKDTLGKSVMINKDYFDESSDDGNESPSILDDTAQPEEIVAQQSEIITQQSEIITQPSEIITPSDDTVVTQDQQKTGLWGRWF
jgi:hypothetical protein